jgi:transposase
MRCVRALERNRSSCGCDTSGTGVGDRMRSSGLCRRHFVRALSIADVARRHGIGTGLLYTWRREMLATAVAGFVPVQVASELEGPSPEDARRAAMRRAPVPRMKAQAGRIEVEFPNGVRVRVNGDVDEAALRGVLAALDQR